MLLRRVATGRERFCREHRRRPAARFVQQLRISPRETGRHARLVGNGYDHLAREQAESEIVANGRFAEATLAQHRTKRIFVEIAVQPHETATVDDFAVDEPRPGAKPQHLREFGDGGPAQHLFEHVVEAALRDERFHRKRRVLLPRLLESFGYVLVQICGADRPFPDDGHPIPAGDAAEHAGIRHVRGGEGDGDQPEKGQGDGDAQLGLEEIAKERNHADTSNLAGARAVGTKAIRFIRSPSCCALYRSCDPAATGSTCFRPVAHMRL